MKVELARIRYRQESTLGQRDALKRRLGDDQRPLHVVRKHEANRQLMKETRVAAFLSKRADEHLVQMTLSVLKSVDFVVNALGNSFESLFFVLVELKQELDLGKQIATTNRDLIHLLAYRASN